jgi:hypothetical protein
MAARKWTKAQRAKQSKAIRTWEPWEKSTGPKTLEGKAVVVKNAYRGGSWLLIRLSRWVAWAINHPETLTPEIVESAKHQCLALCGGFTGWLSKTEAKITTKFR